MKSRRIIYHVVALSLIIAVLSFGFLSDDDKSRNKESVDAITYGVSSGVNDLKPVTDTVLVNNVPSEEQNIEINEGEVSELVSREYISELGNDLSRYSDEEIYIIQKFFTYRTLPEEELPVLFKYFIYGSFIQDGEKSQRGLLKEAVDGNWIAANAYNGDIKHWKSIAEEGDVISTMTLGNFYYDTGYGEEAEEYYQKLVVNIEEKSLGIKKLIQSTIEQDEKLAASYAWYGINNGFESSDKALSNRLINKFSFEEVEEEVKRINEIMENLQINYANSETVRVTDLMN